MLTIDEVKKSLENWKEDVCMRHGQSRVLVATRVTGREEYRGVWVCPSCWQEPTRRYQEENSVKSRKGM